MPTLGVMVSWGAVRDMTAHYRKLIFYPVLNVGHRRGIRRDHAQCNSKKLMALDTVAISSLSLSLSPCPCPCPCLLPWISPCPSPSAFVSFLFQRDVPQLLHVLCRHQNALAPKQVMNLVSRQNQVHLPYEAWSAPNRIVTWLTRTKVRQGERIRAAAAPVFFFNLGTRLTDEL